MDPIQQLPLKGPSKMAIVMLEFELIVRTIFARRCCGGDMALTIEMWLDSLDRKKPRLCPIWPPDVYGISGALLERSGAYLRIFEVHPPDGYLKDVEAVGVAWRKRIDAQRRPTFDSLARARPNELKAYWEALMCARSLPISEIQSSRALTGHLIRMTLIADEASAGIGVDWDNVTEDGPIPSPFLSLADRIKSTQDLRTFGWEISSDVVCVLGKQYTPQVGATFRSLSYHLGRATGLLRREALGPTARII
jgi:hypothetical protein